MNNKKLFKRVMLLQAESNNDRQQSNLLISIIRLIIEMQVKNVQFTFDSYGNMYAVKGSAKLYTCLLSHIDQVHDFCHGFKLIHHGNKFGAINIHTMQQVGIGGDDKCGIYICLLALKILDNVKVCFFKNEEIGCLGSNEANINFFENCSVLIQADRKHDNSEIIDKTNGIKVVSPELRELIKPIAKKHNYVFSSGSITDVGVIVKKSKISGFNISAGYLRPHRNTEYVDFDLLDKTRRVIFSIIAAVNKTNKQFKITDKEMHIPIKRKLKYNFRNFGYNGYNSHKEYTSFYQLNPLCPICHTETYKTKTKRYYCAYCLEDFAEENGKLIISPIK